MVQGRALIVSDSPSRRYFIECHLKNHKLTSIWYPNIMSAQKAIRLDVFSMIIVDLSLPLDSKITFVKEACKHQPDARIITIEKIEYLKKTGALSSLPAAVSLDSIESFPDRLSEYRT